MRHAGLGFDRLRARRHPVAALLLLGVRGTPCCGSAIGDESWVFVSPEVSTLGRGRCKFLSKGTTISLPYLIEGRALAAPCLPPSDRRSASSLVLGCLERGAVSTAKRLRQTACLGAGNSLLLGMLARLGLSGVLAVGWEALAVLGEEVAGKVLAGKRQAHELRQRQ